jgi:hypothetical protein
MLIYEIKSEAKQHYHGNAHKFIKYTLFKGYLLYTFYIIANYPLRFHCVSNMLINAEVTQWDAI